MNRKRKRLLIGAITTVLLVLTGVVAYQIAFRLHKVNTPLVSESSTTSSTSSTDELPKSSSEELTTNEKNFRQALASLERSNEPAPNYNSEISEAIDIAQKSVKEADNIGKLTGNFDNKMMFTQTSVAQTFGIAIQINNYHVDNSELKVFKSENKDVVQFICVLKKAGEDNSYWTGNYNTMAKQLGFVAYYGGDIGATFG